MYMIAVKAGGQHAFLDTKEFSLYDSSAIEVDPYAEAEL
jgi:hypothetical protein